MLRIFIYRKIQRLRPGLNPRIREPEASMRTTRPPNPSMYVCMYVCMYVNVWVNVWMCEWTKIETHLYHTQLKHLMLLLKNREVIAGYKTPFFLRTMRARHQPVTLYPLVSFPCFAESCCLRLLVNFVYLSWAMLLSFSHIRLCIHENWNFCSGYFSCPEIFSKKKMLEGL
jgi:hypothetical protein